MRSPFSKNDLDFSTIIAGNLAEPNFKNENLSYLEQNINLSNFITDHTTILAGNFASSPSTKNENGGDVQFDRFLADVECKEEIEESFDEFYDVNLLDNNIDAITTNGSFLEIHDDSKKLK